MMNLKSHDNRCGATMFINSRGVMTFVLFQKSGKCLTFPVTR